MKSLFLILTVLAPSLSFAQNYSIDWYSIDGGGGTSSGGGYTLTGTIGQPDAGTLTGGNYTLEGGFLSGITLVQTLGSPQLFIQGSGTNALISWAADTGAGFVLQQSLTLNPASWSSAGASLSTNNNIISATVPANIGLKFYRLHKP